MTTSPPISTADRDKLTELAARAEAGSGEDRELDSEIALALDLVVAMKVQGGWEYRWSDGCGRFSSRTVGPFRFALADRGYRLTSSLDAVVALIAERLPGGERIELTWDIGKQAWARWDQDAHDEPWGKASTPARSLLACALRAIAAQQDRQTEGAQE